MDSLTIGVIGIIALVVLVFLGMRVYLAAALVGTLGLVSMIGWESGLGMAGSIPHSKGTSYSLSVLPMFILIGYLAFHAGITEALFDAGRKWLGWLPGGLAVATVVAATGFAAVSGASTATAAVFARIAIPDMLKSGYSPKLAAGVVAAGGTLAALIPPSAILVLYAIIVEQSVGALLVAGFLPGIVTALVYMAIIVVMVAIKPELGKPIRGFTWKERTKSLPGTFPTVLVIVIIFTAMYEGWATPTEAGALGAGVIFVVALTKGMRTKQLNDALMETAKLTVMIFSIIWGVLVFVRFLGFAGLPDAFARWIVALPVEPIWILIGILIFYVILGMFMDAIGMLMLTLPVVYPAVTALGYDPIWFGIIAVKMAEVCLITPPIGLNCFVVNGVRPDIPLNDVFKGIAPFFIAEVIVIAILVSFPEIVTFLPHLMNMK
ncbi:TRAP transporter large permease [Orrella sp. 11846]|uniref:TRAP transporter large permease n=1 Tax=Orrella sp. 11846 TaxID=3409913 RepID=UPI003B599B42